MLQNNERLDDLEYKSLKIIQNPNGYCFTSDSVLLSNLAKISRGDKVVDLGTGSGVIALLVAKKYEPSKVIGVEIQPKLADMAKRSVALNKLDDIITVINKPMQDITKVIGGGFDVVLTNPPYEKAINNAEASEIEICKSEVMVTLKEVIVTASKLLKYGGMFYMINKARRLADAICLMREQNIEPKKIYFIQPKQNKDIDTFIVAGRKGGKPSLIIPKPIVVYNDDGTYTDFARRIYNK
ncbi:MAG: methyltransferase [Clostridiales bacterium]|nr:methyltransferase [Clostridiales bacterium]